MREVTLIRIVGMLKGAWAVGAATADSTINLPVLRDPRTEVAVLPATTLVGSLREHLGPELSNIWFGSETTGGDEENAKSPSLMWASWVRTDALKGDRHVAGSTAIDPLRRSALGRSLRLEERTERPGGLSTRFSWVLEHAGTADPELLDCLANWTAHIGRRQNAGLGDLSIEGLAAYTFDLDRVDHLTWWLADRGEKFLAVSVADQVSVPGSVATIIRDGKAQKPSWLREYRWKVVDPLHVGDDSEIDFADETADRRAKAQRVRRQRGTTDTPRLPVVPGTAWKGIFRHRTSYILNSLNAGTELSSILGVLFGRSPVSTASGAEEAGGRRGILQFADSTVESSSGGLPRSRDRNHVAIDRISGGARDGLLFAKEGIDSGRLTLRITAPMAPPPAVENLLRHIVLDIDEGLIGVGGATTRGYGSIALASAPPSATPIDVRSIAEWCHKVVNTQQEKS